METALDQAPGYYWEAGEDGLLLMVNDTLRRDLGYTVPELDGKPLEFIFTIASRIFFQTHLLPMVQLKSVANEIFLSLAGRDNKMLSVLCNVEKITRGAVPLLAFAGIAVKNRKKFEDELIEAKKAAELALRENTALIQAKKELEFSMEQSALNLDLIRQQNDELQQFNHVVTHVLQEPIRKIAIFSGMLSDPGEEERHDRRKVMDKLLRATGQIRSVVAGLQQYAWLTESPGPFVETDIAEKIRMAKMQVEKEDPDLVLELNTDPVPAIVAEPMQIGILFYQILRNAAAFRKRNSPAVVHIESLIIKHNQLDNLPGRYRYTDHLKITIRDQGIGFDPLYKQHIFELFRKLPPSAGAGVGLALCKKIVDNHHGKISADGEPGAGTTITVLLPVENRNMPQQV